MNEREELIEAITRRVLEALGPTLGDGCCDDCEGGCAACCCDAARSVVDAGASRLSYSGRGGEVPEDLGRYIDHTLLKPDVTGEEIDRLCDEAREFGFAAVCVNPAWVKRAKQRLRGSDVQVASVVGFPLGATTPEVKAMETRRALRDGAREIDMVINIGALKGGDYDLVQDDIAKVTDACREVGAVNKVIIEAVLLTDREKVIACRLAKAARAHYVKTSTGFSSGGATLFDVALMRETVGPEMGVKAAGGIKSADDARKMIDAGATRLGASAGIEIVRDQPGEAGTEGADARKGAAGGGY